MGLVEENPKNQLLFDMSFRFLNESLKYFEEDESLRQKIKKLSLSFAMNSYQKNEESPFFNEIQVMNEKLIKSEKLQRWLNSFRFSKSIKNRSFIDLEEYKQAYEEFILKYKMI